MCFGIYVLSMDCMSENSYGDDEDSMDVNPPELDESDSDSHASGSN